MDESTKSSVISAPKATDNKNSRVGWVDKHAELIKKLEEQYQLPEDFDTDSLSGRFYSFPIAGYNLLISNQMSSELVEDNQVYSIPLAPDWLLGACNLRGDAVPIVDLCQILNGEKTDVSLNKYNTLVLGDGEKIVGVLLDSLPVVMQFKKEESSETYPKFPDLVKPFITEVYKRNNIHWACLDLEMLIASLSKNVT